MSQLDPIKKISVPTNGTDSLQVKPKEENVSIFNNNSEKAVQEFRDTEVKAEIKHLKTFLSGYYKKCENKQELLDSINENNFKIVGKIVSREEKEFYPEADPMIKITENIEKDPNIGNVLSKMAEIRYPWDNPYANNGKGESGTSPFYSRSDLAIISENLTPERAKFLSNFIEERYFPCESLVKLLKNIKPGKEEKLTELVALKNDNGYIFYNIDDLIQLSKRLIPEGSKELFEKVAKVKGSDGKSFFRSDVDNFVFMLEDLTPEKKACYFKGATENRKYLLKLAGIKTSFNYHPYRNYGTDLLLLAGKFTPKNAKKLLELAGTMTPGGEFPKLEDLMQEADTLNSLNKEF